MSVPAESLPRRRPGRRGTSRALPEQVVTAADTLQSTLDALPAHVPHLRLALGHVDLLRHLTAVGTAITVDRISLRVLAWEAPLRRWHGTLGRVPYADGYSVSYPEDGAGEAHAELSVRKPTTLADAARGLYPLLAVDRGLPGYAVPQLGTLGLPAAGLALLPTRTAPGVPGIPHRHLEGVGLSNADLGLVGSRTDLERLEAVADDPAETVFRTTLLVEPSGHLAVSDRREQPLLDLHVHNPVGRLQDYELPIGSLVATVEDGTLVLTPGPDRWRPPRQRVIAPEDRLHGWSRPLGAPLAAEEVVRLRRVESIDLSGLLPADEHTEDLLARRLAELAATGAVLHSLEQGHARIEETLGEALTALLRQPYRASTGLARALRSVPQRREAMERFGGFFELAEQAETLGHRLLPTVSVVLSSMRPGRLPLVLSALAAQRYPHLEVAVALHGAQAPSTPEFEQAVRASGAAVHHYEPSVPFGSVLADLARRTSGDLVIKIDDDDLYGPNVIGDIVLAYLYSSADAVGKTTEYLHFEEIGQTVHRRFMTETYHFQLAGGAMLLSRAALHEIGGWRPTPNSTDRSVLIRLGNAGAVSYRTHSLGYLYIRHNEGHTWKRGDSLLLRGAYEQWPRFMPEIVDA